MTQPRSPIQGLTDLSEMLDHEQPRISKFLRGLAIGALVGAAIAGSTIWQRRLARRSGDRATISDSSEAPR